MIDHKRRSKYRALGIIAAICMLALGPLMPKWDMVVVITYVALWIVVVIPPFYLSNPKRYRWLLRCSAATIAALFLFAAIDEVLMHMRGQSTGFQLKSPITGFIVIGLPALWFAFTGRSKHIDEYENQFLEPDEPEVSE